LAPTCVFILGASAFGVGCSGDDTSGESPDGSTTDGGPIGDGSGLDGSADTGPSGPLALTKLTAAGAFTSIFDAAPSPDGSTIYFTAIDMTGKVGVFAVPIAGGTASSVATGAPFIAPFGIAVSTDGMKLYVADPGVDAGSDLGEMFAVATSGGTPAPVAGTANLFPRGLTITSANGSDTVVFTGIDGTTGAPGAFSIAAAGGAATKIADGSPFVDPSGIAVDTAGNTYVVDTEAAASHRATILKIDTTGATTSLATDLFVGYPAGIAVAQDGAHLIVSGLAAGGGADTVSSYAIAGGAPTPVVSSGLTALFNAAGLHRAATANVYAFVDSAGDGTDAVYAIK
jgi:hypothetical protein